MSVDEGRQVSASYVYNDSYATAVAPYLGGRAGHYEYDPITEEDRRSWLEAHGALAVLVDSDWVDLYDYYELPLERKRWVYDETYEEYQKRCAEHIRLNPPAASSRKIKGLVIHHATCPQPSLDWLSNEIRQVFLDTRSDSTGGNRDQ